MFHLVRYTLTSFYFLSFMSLSVLLLRILLCSVFCSLLATSTDSISARLQCAGGLCFVSVSLLVSPRLLDLLVFSLLFFTLACSRRSIEQAFHVEEPCGLSCTPLPCFLLIFSLLPSLAATTEQIKEGFRVGDPRCLLCSPLTTSSLLMFCPFLLSVSLLLGRSMQGLRLGGKFELQFLASHPRQPFLKALIFRLKSLFVHKCPLSDG